MEKNNRMLGKERMTAVLTNIGDGVISADAEGRIDFMNASAERLTGWNSEEAYGRPFADVFRLIHMKTRESIESPMGKALSSGLPIGLENFTSLISKDGSERLVSANTSPIKNEDGRITGIVTVFRDITRFKQIEEELKAERNNLRTNFEHAPVGMIVIGEDRRIFDANHSFLDMIGIKRKDAIGTRLGESMNCKNSFTNGCGMSEQCLECSLKQSIESVFDTGIPVKIPNNISTLIKDNKEIEKYFKVNFVPLDDSGKRKVVVSLEDITEHKLMEESLARSRDFYLTLFDDFPAMIWRSNTDKKCDYFNKRWLEFKGRTMEQELVDGWRESTHPDDMEAMDRIFEECHDARKPIEKEYRIRRYDGEYRWVHDRSNPYYDLDGRFAGYIGGCYDITEQKMAEVALKKYQVLAEKARDIILFVDMDGCIIEANDSALRLYGYSREEMLLKTVFDLRKDDPEVRKHLDLAKMQGLFFEATHYKKDGTPFPVEVSVQSTVIGQKEVLLSIIRDIGERKKSEAALRENEEKYRSLFDSANDSIFLHEVNDGNQCSCGVFVEVNDAACRELGYSKAELLAMSPKDITSPSSMENVGNIDEEIRKNGHVTFETVHRTRDGNEVPVEISSHALKMNGRNYVLSMVRDISERKQVEIEMKKAMESANSAYRTKSEFLANMSHEIRTPLNGIIGMIDLTMLTELTAEQKDNLYTAKTCADSLLKIINDILDFSKIEVGKLSLEKIDFDLKAMIDKVTRIHAYKAGEKGLDFYSRLSDNLPIFVKGDPARLQQVLNNLLGNAVKFTERGCVEISANVTETSGGFAKIRFDIRDTGIGIAEEEQEKLFKSFSQVDGSHSRKYGGTGLGLVISRQLTEMMGGTIRVESTKGKGSTFCLELGFEVSDAIRQAVAGFEEDKRIKLESKAKILLVEDDPINQLVVSRMLKEMTYAITIANNGIEAISILKQKDFDLCLMDIQMPGMDGIQTTAIIRSDEKGTGRHLPIVALTAHALVGDREKFLSLGMDGYLAKPFQMADLSSLLGDLLRKFKSGNPEDILNKLIHGAGREKQDSEAFHRQNNPDGNLALSEIKENIEQMKTLSRPEDVATVEKLSHEVKLLSEQIGAERVKTLAFRIELTARRGDFTGAFAIIRELDSEFRIMTEQA